MLYNLGEIEVAKVHFAEHYRQGGSPETAFTLAQIYQQQGELAQARDILELMIVKVKGSPIYYYKKHKGTIRKAKKILRSL